jgi:formate-dependent nitrite reductase membrane component NrfD
VTFLAAEHFVRSPEWKWYILLYFFLAGLSGGSYVLGTMLRLFGRETDAAAARLAFLVSFPLLLLCPILLIVDLGQPSRFWHMVIDSGQGGFIFKYLSPMSVGVWGLFAFGLFSFLSFAGAFAKGRSTSLEFLVEGAGGRVVMVLGSVFGLFICAYTGVLLSVSNQPVWSDGWPLGGLFVASAMSGAAALLLLVSRGRPEAGSSSRAIGEADRYFVVLEIVLIAAFLVTVGIAGTLSPLFAGAYLILWLLVAVGVALPLASYYGLLGARAMSPLVTSLAVLAGVLALRAVVIFGAQS